MRSGKLSMIWAGILVAVCMVAIPFSRAQQRDQGTEQGSVRLSLEKYQQLYSQATKPPDEEEPPPIKATISKARVRVSVSREKGRPTEVSADIVVHVLAKGWVEVPLLPAGTSISDVRLGGNEIALSAVGGRMVWSTRDKGQHRLSLAYNLPVTETASGHALYVPVPPAASINLEASIPGDGLEVSVVPASGTKMGYSSGVTSLVATVPRTNGVLLSWSVAGDVEALVTGAEYAGKLKDEVVAWRAKIGVKLMAPDPVTIPMLSNEVALAGAKVDGRDAVVMEREGRLVVRIQGAGRHEIQLDFETPVRKEEGPTSTSLWLPRPPVSSFSLSLPGKKEVQVTPRSGVSVSRRAGNTLATIHLPPSEQAVFSWSEALPETVEEALRANAEIYHMVRAEEGVVQVEALVDYRVTRGSTNTLEMLLPPEVVVNQVDGAGVTDWRTSTKAKERLLNIYLDRDLKGDYRFRVSYELLIGKQTADESKVGIPMLASADVHRQRGMLALISGDELSMQPEESEGMNKVGENQLPAWVRETASRTIAHTYKYVERDSRLEVRLAPPERKRGRYDAVVDTLFSVGDGVLRASATIKISIKSGKLMDLDTSLPEDINLINVTAPSLRDHEVVGSDGEKRKLKLMFTQELEGTLRIEIAYELVLGGDQEKVMVPVIHVAGADTEQGRLAVEALTAVEVKTIQDCEAIKNKRVALLDVQELPRQLTLRTTNPILLAYKYVHADPPFSLVLEVKHHEEMKVQVASIDRAEYQTLYTKDGLALTRATYSVRNRRKQFLKVSMPEGSELWSAELAGQPVKPASGEKDGEVLVPLLKSANSFLVEIVYKTDIPSLGFAGWLNGNLPVPDIVQTHCVWEVFLPESLTYGRVDTNMTILEEGTEVSADVMGARMKEAAGDMGADRAAGEGVGGVLPLRIDVPRKGICFRFEKLYANRGKEATKFSIHYTTAGATTSGGILMILAVAFLGWVAAARTGLRSKGRGPTGDLILGVLAVGVIVASALYLGSHLGWAIGAAIVAAATVFISALLRRRK